MIFEAFLRSLGLGPRRPKKGEVTPEGVAAALQAVLEYNLTVLEALATATEQRLHAIETVTVELLRRVEALERLESDLVEQLAADTTQDHNDAIELPGV